jgi:hypothetical protein
MKEISMKLISIHQYSLLALSLCFNTLSAQDPGSTPATNVSADKDSSIEESPKEEEVMTFEDFIALMIQCNPDIKNARENYLRSLATYRSTRGAFDVNLTRNLSANASNPHAYTYASGLSRAIETGGSVEIGQTNTLTKTPGSPKNTSEVNFSFYHELLDGVMWNDAYVKKYVACVNAKADYYKNLEAIAVQLESAANQYLNAVRFRDNIVALEEGVAEYNDLIAKIGDLPVDTKVAKQIRNQLIGTRSELEARALAREKEFKTAVLGLQQRLHYVDYAKTLKIESKVRDLVPDFRGKSFKQLRAEAKERAVNCSYAVNQSALYTDTVGIELKQAQIGVLPTLSATLDLGVSTEVEGVKARSLLRAYEYRQTERNAKLALSFSQPLCNNSALADLESAESFFKEARIDLAERQYGTIRDAVTAVNDLRLAFDFVTEDRLAIEEYDSLYREAKDEFETFTDIEDVSDMSEYLVEYIDSKVFLGEDLTDVLSELLGLHRLGGTIYKGQPDLDSLVIGDLLSYPHVEDYNCE